MNDGKSRTSLLNCILVTGIIAAALDILAAFLQNYISNPAVTPGRILRSIASALVKTPAALPGWAMALLGLAVHTCIAIAWVALFIAIYSRLKRSNGGWMTAILAAIGYGIVVWVIMNRLVLPVVFDRPFPFQWKKALVGTGILFVAIGIPAVIGARWYGRTRQATD